jgi:hopene-associated glycosyltransferase HpnB
LAGSVFSVPVAAGALALAIWIYLLAGRGGFWRNGADDLPLSGDRDRRRSDVIAIIPARDEADGIGRAVESLAGQVRVIVVDDASTDGTADFARKAGATVVQARPLPPGWSGKLWAISEGLRAAAEQRPEYWLLTDADIVHPPDAVSGLAARARDGNYDLVSYMVTLECRSFPEHALIPAFVFFFFLLYPPAWIRNPRRRTAGAAGGCMLIRREMLERIGGIERIRGALIDDCSLAHQVKRSGGRVWLGLSARSRSLRSYHTFGEIGRMISRTAFTQLRHSWLLLAGTVAGLALTYLVPPALTLFASPGPAKGMGALAWLLMSIAYYPMVRFYRVSWFWAVLLPAIAVFYMGATLHSAVAWLRGRGGMWKGRTHTVQ